MVMTGSVANGDKDGYVGQRVKLGVKFIYSAITINEWKWRKVSHLV